MSKKRVIFSTLAKHEQTFTISLLDINVLVAEGGRGREEITKWRGGPSSHTRV